MKLITYERILSGDTETPISIYSKYVGDSCGFLLESKELPRGRFSFMAADPYLVVKAYKDEVMTQMGEVKESLKGNPLAIVEELMKGIEVTNTTDLPFIGGAVGTVSYDMIRNYEALPDDNEDTIKTPDSQLLFVKEMVVYDHHFHRIHIVVLAAEDESGAKEAKMRFDRIEEAIYGPLEIGRYSKPLNVTFQSNMTKEEYMDAVRKAKQYIVDGDIFQVVLSQRLSGYDG